MKNKEVKIIPVKRRKKLSLKKFVALAKRVRKSFEEEEEYLRKHNLDDKNNRIARFPFSYN